MNQCRVRRRYHFPERETCKTLSIENELYISLSIWLDQDLRSNKNNQQSLFNVQEAVGEGSIHTVPKNVTRGGESGEGSQKSSKKKKR